MRRARSILLWSAVFGAFAFLPHDTVEAEPPQGGAVIEVPVLEMQRLQQEYAAMRAKIDEQEKQLEQLAERASACVAGFNSMHRPGPAGKT